MQSLKALADFFSVSLTVDNHRIGEYVIDSRRIKPGDVFVALKGDNQDGHAFIKDARRKGAIAILCESAIDNLGIPQFTVPDPIETLGQLARQHRQRFNCPVIAITGSNGKTTVKEMIAHALPQPALATQGNFNNHIGVPLMVLRLRDEHRFAVFELGANHQGEIAFTANICKPDVALINNIAPAHIEGFGSIDGVAKAKGEIYEALQPKGIAITNRDDDYHSYWDACIKPTSKFCFSMRDPTADIYAHTIRYDALGCANFQLQWPNGASQQLRLKVPGEHNIANALAAASCLWNVQVPTENIISGLASFSGVNGRQTIKFALNQARVIDDSYNANLRSVIAAIAVLARYNGQRILVLGDMGELGHEAKNHHQKIGEVAAQAGLDALFTVGETSQFSSRAFKEGGRHFKSKSALLEHLQSVTNKNTTLLIKGSRSAAMETIVNAMITPSNP